MNAKFVKNSVMGAKIDPKVEIDTSIFEIGGWKILQRSNSIRLLKLLEEFIDKNEPCLLIGIPSRDSFHCDTVLGTTGSSATAFWNATRDQSRDAQPR